MRYEITINKAMLDDASIPEADKEPIMVTDTLTGETTSHPRVWMPYLPCDHAPCVVFGLPRSNGATVWVEADKVEVDL